MMDVNLHLVLQHNHFILYIGILMQQNYNPYLLEIILPFTHTTDNEWFNNK